MTFSRRGFLTAGIVTAGVAGGAASAEAAPLTGGGRSVTDFGVQPGIEAAQTAALQKAIDEIARGGHPVFFPAGHYTTGTLKIPGGCAIAGPGSAAVLHAKDAETVFETQGGATAAPLTLSGLAIDGGAAGKARGPGRPLVTVSAANVTLFHLRLTNAAGSALRLEKCTGFLQNIAVEGARGAGLWASDAGALTITGCHIAACQTEGIKVSGGKAPAGSLIGQNQITGCGGAGLAVEGSAVVTGNFVSRSRFGLRLGGGGDGHIMATGNLLRECGVGIAVTASGETLLVSINLINEPKEGAIRAFDGDRLVGPDLVRQSAEAYLNLIVAGNVVR